jgi:hypothetical protein
LCGIQINADKLAIVTKLRPATINSDRSSQGFRRAGNHKAATGLDLPMMGSAT